MKAFLLAAGKGERLKPLTNEVPKPLIKVRGKPLIQWHVERLKSSGINEIVINLFYLGHMIEEFLGDGSKFGLTIKYSKEEKLLGTGGGIIKALSLLGEQPFLLLSSDVWTVLPFQDLSLPSWASAHMILVKPDNNLGDLNLDNGLVNNLNQGIRYSYSGISIVRPEIFVKQESHNSDLWRTFLSPQVDRGLVTGEVINKTIFNVNSLKDIQKIDDMML